MVSIAPKDAVRIDITGDSTGFVTGTPPNDATGDLDATVDLPSPNWTYLTTTWEISSDPGIGTASIDAATGEWTYTVDPAEYDALDDGEFALDSFVVTATAYAFNPGGNLQYDTEDQTVNIVIEGVCFVMGTLIDALNGPVRVEDLQVGDLVSTLDNGMQEIRWIESSTIGQRRLQRQDTLQPVRISAGALGQGLPCRDLFVSQQHRILVSGSRVELLFGEAEVLATAKSLCRWPGIEVVQPSGPVEYFHILLDRHEILFAEDAPAESLFLGEEALLSMQPEGLLELAQIFADKPGALPAGFGQAARIMLRDYETEVL